MSASAAAGCANYLAESVGGFQAVERRVPGEFSEVSWMSSGGSFTVKFNEENETLCDDTAKKIIRICQKKF